MDTFRRLFLVAALAGLVSGVFITLVHQISTTPIILAAEVYEGREGTASSAPVADSGSSAAMPEGHDHEHGSEAWAPTDGWERSLATAVADVLTGIGFSLLLVAAYRFRDDRMTWRTGLFWGLAGFVAVVAAPNLGLPPEVPGTEAAALADRQA